MSYASIADLQKELSDAELLELSDDALAGSLANATVQGILTDALGDADALIDSYAGARYTVPLSPTPTVISRLATTLALYFLYLRRQAMPEHRKTAYQDAVRWLENLAKGVVTLGAAEATAAAAPESAVGGPQSSSSADDRIFTSDTLRNL